MSQEKVDRYKQEKASRKETMKKEKRTSILRKTVLGVAVLVLVGWLGYSAYGAYEAKQPRDVVEINYDAVQNYLNDLQ